MIFVVILYIIFLLLFFFFFFFNDTATTEIYTLSLHDALPICRVMCRRGALQRERAGGRLHPVPGVNVGLEQHRSEEHTSELQSRLQLVCRLLLGKKKKKNNHICNTSA